ncbi:MAG: phospholipid carrier-dependent glycosyltransferase [Acidobacteriota bacterium]
MVEFWHRRPAFSVAVLALAVHLAFLLALPAEMQRNESSDYLDFYRPMAERLLDGRGLQDAEGRVAVRYPPGYPMVLAVAVGLSRALPGGEALWIQGLVALCVALSAALLVLLARRLTGSTTLALVVGFGWSFYPPLLWLTKQPNSEVPFLVLMLAGLLAWRVSTEAQQNGTSWRFAAAAGALLGAATLLRPIGLLLAPVLAVAFLVFPGRGRSRLDGPWRPLPRRWGSAALLVGVHMLVLAPWILFVHHETDVWIPVSSGGRLSLLDGLTLGADPEEPSPRLSEGALALTRSVEARRAEIRGPSSAAVFLWRQAQNDPSPVVELLAVKAARAWYGTESVRHEGALLAIQVPALILAALGLWRLGRRHPALVLAIFAVVGYFWGMTFLVLSILRYMVPAMALLMIPIAWLLLESAHSLLPPRYRGLLGDFPSASPAPGGG